MTNRNDEAYWHWRKRAEHAEARVRELEAKQLEMTEFHVKQQARIAMMRSAIANQCATMDHDTSALGKHLYSCCLCALESIAEDPAADQLTRELEALRKVAEKAEVARDCLPGIQEQDDLDFALAAWREVVK